MAGDTIQPAATTEVAPGLFVGGAHECAMPDRAWTRKHVDRESPEYLIARRPRHLVMNMIDADEKFFRLEFFTHALNFIDAHYQPGRPLAAVPPPRVLVHCNMGLSRSPAIALVYLAKRTEELDPLARATYDAARKAFLERYPAYTPAAGIAAFLDRWWERIA